MLLHHRYDTFHARSARCHLRRTGLRQKSTETVSVRLRMYRLTAVPRLSSRKRRTGCSRNSQYAGRKYCCQLCFQIPFPIHFVFTPILHFRHNTECRLRLRTFLSYHIGGTLSRIIKRFIKIFVQLHNQNRRTAAKKDRRSLPKRRSLVCKSFFAAASHAHRRRKALMPLPCHAVPAAHAVQKYCCSALWQWEWNFSSLPSQHPVPSYGIRYG